MNLGRGVHVSTVKRHAAPLNQPLARQALVFNSTRDSASHIRLLEQVMIQHQSTRRQECGRATMPAPS